MSKTARIDQKGRLSIPVDLLTSLKEFGNKIFVTSEDGECIRIYPQPVWREIERRLVRLSLHKRFEQRVLTRVKYFGQAVAIDNRGRVLIPEVLREAAHIEGEVNVLDYENYLEVWNHARLVNNLERAPVILEDEDALDRLAS